MGRGSHKKLVKELKEIMTLYIGTKPNIWTKARLI